MLRFAVVGNPVSHSKSPVIHSLFAQQTGIELQYTREEVSEARFDAFVKQFFASGGRGLNVTVPFKEKAFQLVERLTARAQQARAVNTLFLDEQKRLWGDNTDGIGLVRDLKGNHNIQLRDKRLLILGAGGAVRGALGNLAEESPQSITIVNRTLNKALTLKKEFAGLVNIEALSFQDSIEGPFDIIINGTSTGLHGKVPPLSPVAIGPDSCCYDMTYGNQETAFMRWAAQQGAALTLDGLGMLVEQAAEAFAVWLNVRPQTASVIQKVRADLV
ncbi:MAG: shikimate dehydrogenase [Gammaproteobacteria bacterium]